MQRSVEDADNVEITIRLLVHDNVGKMGDGEFVRSVNGVAAAGHEIQRFVDDAMNAGGKGNMAGEEGRGGSTRCRGTA